MLLSDELYCIAHDDRGFPRVHDRAIDLGLATGLLGELALGGHLTVERGQLSIVDVPLPDDALARTVCEQIAAKRQFRRVSIWLAMLAGWAFDAVGERLERHGMVTRTKKRWHRVTRYVPIDVDATAVPTHRLRRLLGLGEPVTTADGLLLGLVDGMGLIDVLLRDAAASSRLQLADITASLPPELRALIGCLQAAVLAATHEHRAVATPAS